MGTTRDLNLQKFGLIEWNYWYILKKNIPRNKNYFWE
jgi:hypothetical protein